MVSHFLSPLVLAVLRLRHPAARSPHTLRLVTRRNPNLNLGEGSGRGPDLTGMVKRDPVKVFRPGTQSPVTKESAEDRRRNSRQACGSTGRDRFEGRKETAPGSLHRLARRWCRLARRHRAAVLSVAPAARRKPGVCVRCEHCRTDRRKADNSQQQDRETSTHCGHCTPYSGKPYLRERNKRLTPTVPSSIYYGLTMAESCTTRAN